ncbi:MAG: sigma-70 family RNA polymerase sigma factor [Planctomycetota bacterium]
MHAHADALRRLARSLIGDEHHAEDVAQEAWLAAWTRGPRGPGVGGWLARVVRDLSSNARRTGARRDRHERAAARPEAVAAPDVVRARLEAQRQLATLVELLDEPYRTVVYLRYYEDLPPREIARRISAPVHTVKTRLQRGLGKLRRQLRALDGESAAEGYAALAPLLCLTAPARRTVAATTGALLLGGSLMPIKLFAALALSALALGLWGFWPSASRPGALSDHAAIAVPSVETVGTAAPLGSEEAPRVAIEPPPDPAQPASDPGRTYTGFVTDAAGAPLATAIVEVHLIASHPPVVARTDASGEYVVSIDVPGAISRFASLAAELEARAVGHGIERKREPEPKRAGEPGHTTRIDFQLQPLVHAVGRLVDAQGQSVSDVAVGVASDSGVMQAWTRSGTGGEFRVELGGMGGFWLAGGSAAAGRVAAGPFQLPAAGDLDVGVLALRPAARLEGQVRFPDGQPIARAEVHARRLDDAAHLMTDTWLAGKDRQRNVDLRATAGSGGGVATADGDGRFVFDGLAPGAYELAFPTLAHGPATLTAGPYRTGEFAAVELEAYRVRARVVDGDGLAVPGARLGMMQGRRGELGESRGLSAEWEFAAQPGTWVVTASVDGARPAEREIAIIEGRYDYSVELVLDFAPAMGRLRTVVENEHGVAIDGYTVTLFMQDSSSIVADFSGLAPDVEGVLPSVPTGPYGVRAVFEDRHYFAADGTVVVRAGEVATLRLVARRGGRLRFALGDAALRQTNGDQGLRLVLEDASGASTELHSLVEWRADGSVIVESPRPGVSGVSRLLEPGWYRVQFLASDRVVLEAQAVVEPGVTTDVLATPR